MLFYIFFCLIQLLGYGYGYILDFTKEPLAWGTHFSDWYSLFLTIAIVLTVYLVVDKKTSDKIDEVKCIEKNIQKNIKNLSEITTKIQGNVDKISNIQDKLIFEMKKNRLMNFAQYSFSSEEKRRFFRDAISVIFDEKQYRFSQIDKVSDFFIVKFIKKNSGLPKMFCPFSKVNEFPYFCVQVIETPLVGNESGDIQLNSYYYLTYNFFDKSWYMAKNYSRKTSTNFKITFYGPIYDSSVEFLSAEEFCKDC